MRRKVEFLAASNAKLVSMSGDGVKFHNFPVIDTKKLVKSGDHSLLAAFAFAVLLLNELVHGISDRFVLNHALHYFKACFSQVSVSAFGNMPFIGVKFSRLERRSVNACVSDRGVFVCETANITDLGNKTRSKRVTNAWHIF